MVWACSFPAVIMHLKDPKSAALIFGTGKMVVTGQQPGMGRPAGLSAWTIG